MRLHYDLEAINLRYFALYAVILLGVFIPSALARAQAPGSFLIAAQGIVNATTSGTTACGGTCITATYYLGTGHSGSTTSAFLSVKGSLSGTTLLVGINQWPTNDYTGTPDGECQYYLPPGASGSVDGFVQLTSVSGTYGAGCILNAAEYIQVNIEIASIGSNIQYYYGGTFLGPAEVTWHLCIPSSAYFDCHDVGGYNVSGFFPYFAIVGNNFFIPPPNYSDLATSTCTISNITGCFQNALVWAFFPPGGSFDGILSLQGLLNKKPPFGYFTVAQNDISALGAATSSIYTLGSVTGITEYIFSPIDLGLTAIWWAIVGIWFFFHRARHIDI